jgi:hypothetical protein
MCMQTSVRDKLRSDFRISCSNALDRPLLCFHTVTVLYGVVLYRDHGMEPTRPKWATLKGTRFVGAKTLADAGIKRDWNSFLNVMIGSVQGSHEGGHITMDITEEEQKELAKKRKLERERKKILAGQK